MHLIIDEGITSGESSGEDTRKGKVIPDDDLIVQILARLDGSAYREALYQDAGSINDNYLFKHNFPWHSGKYLLPQEMIKSMPRDIDELHVIKDGHCQDELHSSQPASKM